MIYKYKNTKFKIQKSNRKNKEYKATNMESGKIVHFADPNMREYPGSERGNNYCSRSLGIAKKFNIKGDTSSANFWSRQMWSCKGKKSVSQKRFFGKV